MRTAALLLFLAAPALGADPYYLAERQAVREGKFLVVYQGCPACRGFGDVLTCAGDLRGYPPCCAIVCKPGEDGYLRRVAVVENPSIDAVNAAIEAARPKPPAAVATPPQAFVPAFGQPCRT